MLDGSNMQVKSDLMPHKATKISKEIEKANSEYIVGLTCISL